MLIALIYLKWNKLLILTVKCNLVLCYLLNYLDYLDRYKNTRLLQIQTSGDEFFIPDDEVK